MTNVEFGRVFAGIEQIAKLVLVAARCRSRRREEEEESMTRSVTSNVVVTMKRTTLHMKAGGHTLQ